jgi:hypothetical protein
MGIVRTPICGTHLCGDGTVCGRWEAQHGRAKLLLNGRGFAAGWVPDGVVGVTLGRPKLFLRGRSFTMAVDTTLVFGRSVLTLKGRPFVISPLLRVLLGRGVLYLRGRPVAVSLSSTLTFGKPRLILQGRPLLRAGKAGLIPTVPESRTLTPSAFDPDAVAVLTPSVSETGLLTPSEATVR